MHTQSRQAETLTKISSMKWQFHQYAVYLLKIAAYSSMKYSFPKMMPKICDL